MDARAILRAFDFPGEIMSSLRQRRPLGPKDSGDAPLEPQETDSDHYSYPDSKLKSSQRSPALLPLQIVAVTDWITPLVLTLLAFFTRLYLISRNNHVVWCVLRCSYIHLYALSLIIYTRCLTFHVFLFNASLSLFSVQISNWDSQPLQ